MAIIDTSKVTIPKGFFEDLNVPKLLEWLNSQPTADVVPRDEVGKDIDVATKELAKKICCEIEEEIVAALDSNYKALRTYDDGRNNDYILELVGRIKGKIDALRGIEAFVEELKEKYTKGGEQK